MIAYDHYIKFVPELKNNKKIEGPFIDTITIKKKSHRNWNEVLTHKWTFYNNQRRYIDLYTDHGLQHPVKGQVWAFDVKEVVTFFWESGSKVIGYMPQKDFSPVLLEYWSLHTLLPIYFTVEGIYDFLHAGAVEVEAKPILFVADSFGGKSTMTDFFMQKGHAMISDDKVGVFKKNDICYAVASHPHHRPYRKAEDLGYFIYNMASEPKPIHAIYKLNRVSKDDDTVIREITGIDKFINVRLSSQINLPFLNAERFALFSDLARGIPMYEADIPWDTKRLCEVYKNIIDHLKTF